jgi:hypothetical protein
MKRPPFKRDVVHIVSTLRNFDWHSASPVADSEFAWRVRVNASRDFGAIFQ